MDTKLKFLMIMMILLISYIACDDATCSSYHCGTLDSGVCSVKNGTEFTLQVCGDDMSCNFDKADKDNCQANSKLKSFPGGSCLEDSDCQTAVCFGEKCDGVDLNFNCTHHGECLIGAVCRLNTTDDTQKMCLAALLEGQSCIEDQECDNSHGCLAGVCTKYFSQEDDALVARKVFCKSGFVFNNTCATIRNVNPIYQPCTEDLDCKYQFANGTAVSITGSCLCGLNKDGNKYCELGSVNEFYKDWVSSNLVLLENTTQCHTTERDINGICVERTLKDRSFAYRKTSQYTGNNMTYAQNFPLLANSDDCVKYIAFSSFNDSIVRPDAYQCPKYSCNKNGKSCLASNNPFNEDGTGVTVSLSNTCKENEQCQGLKNIFVDASVQGKCVGKSPKPDIMGVRFPGEDCDDSNPCINEQQFNSTCVDKKCTGKKENEVCNTTTQCLVGLYCNGTVCLPQVKEGSECKDIYDCSNNLGCYNGTCTELGKLKEGADISFDSIGQFATDPKSSLFCQYGQANFENQTFCAVVKYANETALNLTSDGFAKCNLGEQCSYTDGVTIESKDCECGYNANGQGYCPLSQEKFASEWVDAVKHKVNKMNNKCHSLSRFECYKVNKNLNQQDALHERKTQLAHVFYNSVNCAYDVLSGSSLGLSVLAFLMTVFAIFF